MASSFTKLTDGVSAAVRIAYPLAELNDLLTNAPGEEIEALPQPSIDSLFA